MVLKTYESIKNYGQNKSLTKIMAIFWVKCGFQIAEQNFLSQEKTRLRFGVFSLERLKMKDKVFVLPPLEIGLSVAVGEGGVILSLSEAYILSLSLLLCLKLF